MSLELRVDAELLRGIIDSKVFREKLLHGMAIMKEFAVEASFSVYYNSELKQVFVTDVKPGRADGVSAHGVDYDKLEDYQVPIIEAHSHGGRLVPSPIYFSFDPN